MAPAPRLRDDVRDFLALMSARPRPPLCDESIAQMRRISPEAMAQMMSDIEAPLGDLAVDRTIAMPGPGGAIDLRLFDARAERSAGPVVVFFHGGGFVTGHVATHAPLAAEIARGLDLPVVSVDYRLAPEHRWPAAPDDGEAAARWIAVHADKLGLAADSLVLCGDSAGATLALVTALALRERPAAVPLRMLVALYPQTDSSRIHPSREAFADGFGLSRDDMAYFDHAYEADPVSLRTSPLLADLSGLPPTVLATAEFDPLRDSGRAFAAKLVDAGVPVAFHEAAGTIHGFATFRRGIPSAVDDLARVLALARAMGASG